MVWGPTQVHAELAPLYGPWVPYTLGAALVLCLGGFAGGRYATGLGYALSTVASAAVVIATAADDMPPFAVQL